MSIPQRWNALMYLITVMRKGTAFGGRLYGWAGAVFPLFAYSGDFSRDIRKRFRQALFLLLATTCLAVTSGCGGKTTLDGSSAGSSGPTFFTPMTEKGVSRLSVSQAKALAVKMDPKNQGLRGWRELDFAVSQSLAHASTRPAQAVAFAQDGLTLTYGRLTETLHHLRGILPRLDADPGLLAEAFTWYRIGPDFGFTGYYEPTLHASRTRSKEYYYPLYRLPPELKSGRGYHTRHAIDRRGALAGRGLEIAWVNSEADAFFLHVQGSGRLRFRDGTTGHVLFAGKNNRAYVSLGRVMRDQGLLEPDDVNMRSIRRVLREHPKRQAELFDANPSYVFFRESNTGPYGAMGRLLTPWVSTATDTSLMPHGVLNFLILPLPDASGRSARPFHGLTLPQDVGGAIKGSRIDLFCGTGGFAEHTAGFLNARGAVYILVKK